MKKRGTILPSVQAAAGRGIVIQISGDGESARKALEMVEKQLQNTEQAGNRFGQSMGQSGSALEHGVPKMAAASAGLRALEGNFTNNIRAGERFLTMLPGVGEALSTAFPAIGAIVLATALVKVADEAFHAYQNIVLLKGAMEGLNSLEITVGKKVAQAADQAEASLEKVLEVTQGKLAAHKQKLAYESGKGIDLTDYFYSEEFKKLPTDVKANYETMYKAIAPEDIPKRLSGITSEIKELKKAMTDSAPGGTAWHELSGPGGYASPGASGASRIKVDGYGPSVLQSQQAYYKTRLQAATQIQELLQAENKARDLKLQATGLEGDKTAKPKAGHSDNPIEQASVALAQEQAKAMADAARTSGQTQLAALETQHKLMLTSDLDYYRARFDIANADAAAEQASITDQTVKLQELQKLQHADKLLKRDKQGNSAEELKTAKELVQLKEKQAALDAKQMEAESRYTGEVGAMNNAAEIAGLRVAAQLERERNQGIAAQIALIQREHEIEARKSTLGGGSEADAQAIRATGALAVQKLQLKEIEDDIAEVERKHRRAVEDTTDAVAKGDITKRTAAQQTKAANADELQALRSLVEQYRALAAAIGDPTLIEKSKDLDQQLATLGRTDRRGTFGKEVQDGLQGITTSIIDSAARGKQSFADMARSILDDLDRLALKMAEEKFILPLFEQAFGGGKGGGQGSGGGGSPGGGAPTGNGGGFGAAFGLPSVLTDPNIGGGGGPSIYKPAAKEGGGGTRFLNSLIGVAGKLATSALSKKDDDSDGGDDSSAPSSTVNIHNHSSQPVGATSTTSWDSDARQFIIDVVLQNHLEGGALSQT